MKIMRVKQQDGTLVDIPFGKGANGKSAYQYAKDGGYTGTEAEFTQLLGNLDNGGSYTETDPTVPDWAKKSTKPTYTAAEVGALPSTTKIPSKVSDLTNDSGFITSAPVISVNNKTGAITLSASDVGALPNTTIIPTKLSDLAGDSTHRVVTDTEKSTWNAKANTSAIPTKVSQLTNDSGFITGYTETDPTVPSWAKASTKPSYTKSEVGLGNVDNVKQYSASNPPPYPVTKVNNKTGAVTLSASDVGADASGTAKTAVSTHDVDTIAHADIRAQISKLSSEIAGLGGNPIPDYWQSELETKADAIQQAMEKAGRNKSAFLWYTDAHWVNGNSKMSPKLLNYLYMNTPMNKVNFGGDIIGDTLLATRNEMKYLYEWRKAIKDLPNHHSIFGNHDMFNLDSVDYEDDNYRYSFLLAPEETSDMVFGDGNYYYIDNPAEKTRYLYIAYMSTDQNAMLAQGTFIVDAIKSVPEGWHIVAIAHRWWQYSSSSTPTTGSIPNYEKDILSVFDAYNARATRSGSNYFATQDFTQAKGKVEFCIGGHIHVDYDIKSEGGIPIIITTADANQNRVPNSTVDSGTVGTITEAAVFGIIADYNDVNNTKITVVGVGRGTSRVVGNSEIKQPISISNIIYHGDTTIGATIDVTRFEFTATYSDGTAKTIMGATSVSPNVLSNASNLVTVTYTEEGVSVNATCNISAIEAPEEPEPGETLLNLYTRKYVAGTAGEVLDNYLDESKAYINVPYGNRTFGHYYCAVSDISTYSVTVKEPGQGGITVAYYISLEGLNTESCRVKFNYSGTGKCRTYYSLVRTDGTVIAAKSLRYDDTSGASGSADVTIDFKSETSYDIKGIIIYLGSNTSGTKTFSNVVVTSDAIDTPDTPDTSSNEIRNAINSDGAAYVGTNGEDGYIVGKRLNSSGVEADLANHITTGFIPYSGGDVELILPTTVTNSSNMYFHIYSSDFNVIKKTADGTVVDGSYHTIPHWVSDYGATRTVDNASHTQTVLIPASSIHANTRYIRISSQIETGVTISDETFRVSFVSVGPANLLNLNRTYVSGTVGEMLDDHLDKTKAYTNVPYGSRLFDAKTCTVSDITENSVTVKEAGSGGFVVAYYIDLQGLNASNIRVKFDYSGAGKCRTYYSYVLSEAHGVENDGAVDAAKALFINDTSGASGSADVLVDVAYLKGIIIYLGTNTSQTKTFSNMSVMIEN